MGILDGYNSVSSSNEKIIVILPDKVKRVFYHKLFYNE